MLPQNLPVRYPTPSPGQLVKLITLASDVSLPQYLIEQEPVEAVEVFKTDYYLFL